MRFLFIIFCAAALFSCSDSHPLKEEEADRKVIVEVAEEANRSEVVTQTGIVAFRAETTLSFSSAGRIDAVYVREGEIFSKGAVLASLDTSSVRAALIAAEASLEQARGALERREELYVRGWVTKADLEIARAQFASAKAQVDTQRFHVDNAAIVALGKGVLLKRIAEPGQIVVAAEPVLLVGDLDQKLVLRVSLPQELASDVQIGATAKVNLPSASNGPLDAVLIQITPKSDDVSGTFLALFALSGATSSEVGQLAKLKLRPSINAEPQIVLPLRAMFDVRADEGFVYVIDSDNRAKVRKVEIGRISEDGVFITKGIAVGERVAITGLNWLTEGVTVTPVRTRP